MIEAVYEKALRYDGHAFEAELIEKCAVGRGGKIALPRDVEDVEDEDILPFQSINILLDTVAENLTLHGEITSRPGMVGAQFHLNIILSGKFPKGLLGCLAELPVPAADM